jgi:hypothetical protein
VAGALLGMQPSHSQNHRLSDLPPDARPAGLSVYLEASVSGTMFYVCRSTDVIGRFGWYLRASEATLRDGQKNEMGKSHFNYSGIPRARVEASWEDVQGGRVVAKAAGHGPIPTNSELEWRRFDIQSHSGEGRITEARAIVRIAAWRTIPYAERCDKSRAAVEVRSSFAGTDFLFK